MSFENSVAVVLGSGLKADGTATEVTALRAKAAAALVKSRPMRLIASGSRAPSDTSEHGKTEAAVMAEIVKAEGVPEDVLLEDQSFGHLRQRYLHDLASPQKHGAGHFVRSYLAVPYGTRSVHLRTGPWTQVEGCGARGGRVGC